MYNAQPGILKAKTSKYEYTDKLPIIF